MKKRRLILLTDTEVVVVSFEEAILLFPGGQEILLPGGENVAGNQPI